MAPNATTRKWKKESTLPLRHLGVPDGDESSRTERAHTMHSRNLCQKRSPYSEPSCQYISSWAESPSHQSAKGLMKSIQRNFGTLPFCRRYLDHAAEKNYLLAVSARVPRGHLRTDTRAAQHTCQGGPSHGLPTSCRPTGRCDDSAICEPFLKPVAWLMLVKEHTILLRPTCKEVVSRGDDY